MSNIPYRFKRGRIIYATVILIIAFITFGAAIAFWVLSATNQITYDIPLILTITIIVFGILITIGLSIASIMAYIDIYKYQCKKEFEHYLNL